MRRPRNVRLSHSTQYHVITPAHINESLLDIYRSTSVKTGLEADEEKEYHFKNIMMGKTDTIFIPLIERVDIVPKGEKYELQEKYLEKEKDVELDIFNNDEIQNMADNLEISFDKLKGGINDRKKLNELFPEPEDTNADKNIDDKKKKIIDLIHLNTINTSDLDDTNTKLCYRNRKILTIRKGRKNDSFILEKIVKFNTEIDLLFRTCEAQLNDLKAEKDEIQNERELLYTLSEYFSNFSKSKMHRRKRILKDIYKSHVLDSKIKVYQTVKNFQELINSPEKMALIIHKLNKKVSKKESERAKVYSGFLKGLFDN
ncbi:hypothetical protein CDIK_0586 [Cucumispora dikerogammari]|nr:hypothetical protein CDIK_0586 [Cucumispora dikerogammari]